MRSFTGCSAVWSAHSHRKRGAAGSNPAIPTTGASVDGCIRALDARGLSSNLRLLIRAGVFQSGREARLRAVTVWVRVPPSAPRSSTPTGRETAFRPQTVRVRIPGRLLRPTSRTGICGGFKPRVSSGFESQVGYLAVHAPVAQRKEHRPTKPGCRGFDSLRACLGPVAQWSVQPPVERKVVGSSPIWIAYRLVTQRTECRPPKPVVMGSSPIEATTR